MSFIFLVFISLSCFSSFAFEEAKQMESMQPLEPDYKVKTNAGLNKFQRITINEKAIGSLNSRMIVLENKIKQMERKIEKLEEVNAKK